MKKTVSLLLAAFLLLLTACNSVVYEEPEVKEEAVDQPITWQIGIASAWAQDEFLSMYCNELEAYFYSQNTRTVQYTVTIADGGRHEDTQRRQIEDFLAQPVDILILAPLSYQVAETAAKQAADAGIPLIITGRTPLKTMEEAPYAALTEQDGIFYVGSQITQAGGLLYELTSSLKNNGDSNDDEKTVCLLLGEEEENGGDPYWMTAFTQAAEKGEAATECREPLYGGTQMEKVQELCAQTLQEHGDEIDVILCGSDTVLQGACAALKSGGYRIGENIYLLGIGFSNACMDMLYHRELSGLVTEDYIAQAHETADTAAAILAGTAVEKCHLVNYGKKLQG